MVLTDARQNLADLRYLESNILGIAACFFEAENILNIRLVETRSKYKGHVAATEIESHPVDVACLLLLPVSHNE